MIGTFNTITNNTFESLENIEELTITTYNLSSVEPLAFYYLPELKSLNIGGTYWLSVADFYPALIVLQRTKLENLPLSSKLDSEGASIVPKDNNIPELVVLNDSFCENLDLPYLTHLHLDHSLLYQLGSRHNRNCFSKLSKLRVLNLSFNGLSTYEIGSWDLSTLENLVEIDISHQNYPLFGPYDVLFASPRNLVTLDMSSILQPSAENTWDSVIYVIASQTKYLNFQSNAVTVLKVFDSPERNPGVPFEVDFSQNDMISFEGSFDVAIRDSNLTVVSLFLSANQLGKQLDDRGDHIFKYFLDLTKLDLTLNGIKQLPYSRFESIHKMDYLNLSKNSLLSITFKISHMKNLKSLDMSENLVSQFNAELQTDLDEVKSHSPNFTINMLGNPFQCSCETRSFLWCMYYRRSMFERFEKYTCTYNGNLTRFSNMKQLLKTIDYDCSSKLILKVTASLFVSIVIVIALSVFLYRHKWDVRFFCLRYVTNRKAYQELEESEEEYEYDAFVSFHSDDQDWVWNELHEILGRTEDNVETDDQPRFRLCIHERDFVPGGLIEENILRSIESSRKTIVVLSRNFMKCMV